ncbi:MAG: hypothetical protein KGH71_02340 [Candidatus Micrarchaeota archaeon]|nr:hypothetical protein [Candidatus Micrarchaeota archaeon]
MPVSEKLLLEVEKRSPHTGTDRMAIDLGSTPFMISVCSDILKARKHLDLKILRGIEGITTNITLSENQKKFDFFRLSHDE